MPLLRLRDLLSDELLHIASYLNVLDLVALSAASLLLMSTAVDAVKERLKEYYPNITPSLQCMRLAAEVLEGYGVLGYSNVASAFAAWDNKQSFLGQFNTTAPSWADRLFHTRLILFCSTEPVEQAEATREWLLERGTAVLNIKYDKLKGNSPCIDYDDSKIRALKGLTRKEYGDLSQVCMPGGWNPPQIAFHGNIRCVGMVLWDAAWDVDGALVRESFSSPRLLWRRPEPGELLESRSLGASSSCASSSAATVEWEPSRLAMAIMPMPQMRAFLASKGIADDARMHRDEMITMIMALRETSKPAAAKDVKHRNDEEQEDEDDVDASFPEPID